MKVAFVSACRNLAPSWSHASLPIGLDFRQEAAHGFASFEAIGTAGSAEDGMPEPLLKTGEKVLYAVLALQRAQQMQILTPEDTPIRTKLLEKDFWMWWSKIY